MRVGASEKLEVARVKVAADVELWIATGVRTCFCSDGRARSQTTATGSRARVGAEHSRVQSQLGTALASLKIVQIDHRTQSRS